MNQSFSEELFLTSKTGSYLYHTYAEHMPIIDYHCHLPPKEIYENKQFEDLGEMWLANDHYKWRAMRTFGIEERLITGDSSYYEKFMAFAGIMPELIGNPLYIWCGLELKRFFGIDQQLSAKNAAAIYQKTKQLIQEKNMCPRWCMEVSKVELVSTTEDPIDPLEYHLALNNNDCFKTRIISAFRPDKALYCDKEGFAEYLGRLSEASGQPIDSFRQLIDAIHSRLKFFATIGTNISDCGLEYFHWADYTEASVEVVFQKAVRKEILSQEDINQFRTAFLLAMGHLYFQEGFVMQIHIGTYLDANTKGKQALGQSSGYDCADDSTEIKSLGRLLDTLTMEDKLPKVILYPLNANEIEPYAILAAAFCSEKTRSHVQLGAPWWFNDQIHGIVRQFEAVANLYPVSLSVGMLTDSRSFLSYPRHELYRRAFCNYLGTLIDRGEYYSDEDSLKKIIENVCYYNAKALFVA